VRALEIKEMPVQEKLDGLLESYIIGWIRDSALHKELGAVDKCNALTIEMEKKMLASYPEVEKLKAIASGRTFKWFIEKNVYLMQALVPLSNMELSYVSDREAVVTVKNCPVFQKMGELVRISGVNVDPRECIFGCPSWMPNLDAQVSKVIFKEFGVDFAWEHTENGCKWTLSI